jgi:hypothetical protein
MISSICRFYLLLSHSSLFGVNSVECWWFGPPVIHIHPVPVWTVGGENSVIEITWAIYILDVQIGFRTKIISIIAKESGQYFFFFMECSSLSFPWRVNYGIAIATCALLFGVYSNSSKSFSFVSRSGQKYYLNAFLNIILASWSWIVVKSCALTESILGDCVSIVQ